MTRVKFDIESAFLDWLENRKRDYEVYYDNNRIFAIPQVSTRPVLYGVLETTSSGESYKLALDKTTEIVGEDDVYPIRNLTFGDQAEASGDDE